jgi:iron complex transport system substrate-binding protein
MKETAYGIFVFLMIIAFSCSGKNTTLINNQVYYNNAIISYAERLKIEKKEGYSQLSILNPWQGANEIIHTWYLVPRGSDPPDGVDSAKIIFTPVRKIICMSTTYLPMILSLNEVNSISGVSGTEFIFGKELTERVDNGHIVDVGYEDNINKELIISIKPDLVMTYGIGNESTGYLGKIREFGIRVMFNADYLETDPLGKAEWIKMFGALFCKEEEADIIFRAIENEYNTLKEYISGQLVSRPSVLLGLPYRDTWYVSPGNSYISRLIDDAGGNYLWNDTRSFVSMPLGIENVYLKALKAEYWLNIGNINSRKEILAIDPRLEDFPCFSMGNLYNNNKRINLKGGNDYWESGNMNPHAVLKDIASILHPELLSDHKLFYYTKIY